MRPKRDRLDAAAAGRRTKEVSILLSPSESVTLLGSFPVSEQSWEQLVRVLEALKPGLVMPPLSLHEDSPSAPTATRLSA